MVWISAFLSQPIIPGPLFATYFYVSFFKTMLLLEHNSDPVFYGYSLITMSWEIVTCILAQALWCAVARFGGLPNFLWHGIPSLVSMSKQCHMFSIWSFFIPAIPEKPCHCTPHCLCKDILYVTISYEMVYKAFSLVTCIFLWHSIPSLVSHVQTMSHV